MVRAIVLGAALAGLALGAGSAVNGCWAWDAAAYGWISGIAIEMLPDTVPAFVHAPEAEGAIAKLAREPAEAKGEVDGAQRNPGYHVDLADNAQVMGVVPLARPLQTRQAYDAELKAKGVSQVQAGYLPYPIMDGWNRLREDFAYWRALTKAIETAETPEERAWFEAERRRRETRTIGDVGIWSRYVGAASDPLNATVHFNGWGDFPNPNGYTDSKNLRAYFEGEFVRRNLSRAAIAAAVKPYRCCSAPIEIHTTDLLFDSFAEVVWLYRLEKDGAFTNGHARGIAFATTRLATGATALRDMIAQAWRKSDVPLVGNPGVNVNDIENGKVRATRALFGAD
ncbi:MAG: hypothetical protein JOY64_06460 [Alphaproteobacteria bacterium]|nr:hypothetical protein [Alphaproteobacteria bacterium]MBV8407253.1 hypothetical protein [Alphaproteobacteria bacterium]